MRLCVKSFAVRKTHIGLFLASGLLGAAAFLLPNAAEAKRLGNDFELSQESQSHAIKIPKVRRKARPNQKVHDTGFHWHAVPVHSPACTETPALALCTQSPILDDDDDDVVLGDTAAIDNEKRTLVCPKVSGILFQSRHPRVSDPKPRSSVGTDRPLALSIRVRTLPKLPDSADDAARA
jgi:hypothetical protein